jgi:hypothetical protein
VAGSEVWVWVRVWYGYDAGGETRGFSEVRMEMVDANEIVQSFLRQRLLCH